MLIRLVVICKCKWKIQLGFSAKEFWDVIHFYFVRGFGTSLFFKYILTYFPGKLQAGFYGYYA